jgi:hypothetical protein
MDEVRVLPTFFLAATKYVHSTQRRGCTFNTTPRMRCDIPTHLLPNFFRSCMSASNLNELIMVLN